MVTGTSGTDFGIGSGSGSGSGVGGSAVVSVSDLDPLRGLLLLRLRLVVLLELCDFGISTGSPDGAVLNTDGVVIGGSSAL